MEVELKNMIPATELLSDFFGFAKMAWKEVDEFSRQKVAAMRREERCYLLRDTHFTSGEMASSYHRRMVVGAGMVEDSRLPKDIVLFSASLPAFQIAELACGVASESGRLLEIHNILNGNGGGELNEAEYLSLEEEGERILGDIYDTVFVYLLRSYGHDDFADLFEQDSELYQARCEKGRLLVVSGD